jgi:hypothetical protein
LGCTMSKPNFDLIERLFQEINDKSTALEAAIGLWISDEEHPGRCADLQGLEGFASNLLIGSEDALKALVDIIPRERRRATDG